MTLYYSSNDATSGFDATATGVLPAGWSNANGGAWQVSTSNPVGGHSKSFTNNNNADGQLAVLTGISPHADMEMQTSQKAIGFASSGALIGSFVRMDAGGANGYLFLAATGQIRLFRRQGGAFSVIGNGSAVVTGASTDVLRMRVQCQGSILRGKLWNATTGSEPTAWDLVFTDTAISAAGYAGLYYGTGGGTLAGLAVDDLIVSDVPALSVTTPGAAIVGAPLSIAGTYSGPDPAGLNMRFDGASYTSVASPSIGGGVFSFTATAPAAGSHTVSVQASDNLGNAGVSGSFSSGAISNTISVATPGSVSAGSVLTVTGTYSGTAPSGLNMQFDASGYSAVSVPSIGGGVYSFTTIAPAAGSHTVSVQEANAPAVVGVSAAFTVTAAAGASIAPNNAALVYTPYNWSMTSAAASTINAGAGFRVLFSGVSCALNFDLSNNLAPLPQIWWRIDGFGGWTQATLASTIACAIPAATLGNADVPYHLLEVVVKSTTETQNRWNTPSGTGVVFTGLTLAAGAAVAAPASAPLNILVFGDSITEGVRALGESAANDTDRNDAMSGWAYRLGTLLGAEVGIVGFGGSGLSVMGSGNVPPLSTSYAMLCQGVARSFSPTPAMVVFNVGTNDGSANTVPAMTAVLNAVMAACPGAVIAVMRPFNGNQAANLQSAIAACATPAQCHYIDTTGFLDASKGVDSGGVHPSGVNNIGVIAPRVAAALRPFMSGGAAGGGAGMPAFRGGFQCGRLG